jgi:hypothetical protein
MDHLYDGDNYKISLKAHQQNSQWIVKNIEDPLQKKKKKSISDVYTIH